MIKLRHIRSGRRPSAVEPTPPRPGAERLAIAGLFAVLLLLAMIMVWEVVHLAGSTAHGASEQAESLPFHLATLAAATFALLLAAVGLGFLRARGNATEAAARRELDRVRLGEQRVRESERRLQDAQRLACLGSWELVPADGRIAASPEALRLYGLDPYRFDGRVESMLARIHPDDRGVIAERFFNPDHLAMNETSRFTTEYRILAPDGSVRTLEVLGRLATREDGTAVINGTSQDISERKRTARAVRAKLEAERTNRAKNEFLSRMSHELRTPLHAVLGYGRLVAESEGLSVQAQDDTGQILVAGDHLLKLIDEILEISRIDDEQVTAEIQPVDLCAVADEADGIVRPLAVSRGISIEIEIERVGDARYALGDSGLLRQVFVNLLSNAVKYNRDGGEVHLRVEPRGLWAQISVSDTGIGIDPKMRDRIFTPRDRLGADVGTVPGTGLGLALSQRLCKEMGAVLDFESRPGAGSRFWFKLPIATGSRERSRGLNRSRDPSPLTTKPLVLAEAAA